MMRIARIGLAAVPLLPSVEASRFVGGIDDGGAASALVLAAGGAEGVAAGVGVALGPAPGARAWVSTCGGDGSSLTLSAATAAGSPPRTTRGGAGVTAAVCGCEPARTVEPCAA
jgi:hypothetical protein